ncbi:unnamed protein product [Adineta ricciae]|uniref:Type VII secretion system protein EssD-like domain-containing protein n=1 Tax=Adineta ricciae TaxID=249248 RepID=A0A815RV82_ADIRI|nr:unnamed protein product [Adineta ricciae]CAF1639360.1 unnamed protein product [Adineta ricciae]
MGDFTIAGDTDSEDNLANIQQYDNLRRDLDGYNRPYNLTDGHLPIRDASVQSLSSGETGQKTCWLLAEIYPCHVGTGQPTSTNRDLAKKIRARGKQGDDCGHIIACSLGGKMVDFNLFPQNRDINRGWKDMSRHWRTGVERAIEIWLMNPSLIQPRVEFQIRFYYDDKKYPDRPDHGKFLVRFMCSGKKENNNAGKEVSVESYTILKGVLMNIMNNEPDSDSSTSYKQITPAQAASFHRLSIEQFKDFVTTLLQEYIHDGQQHQSQGLPTASSTFHVQPRLLKFK